jgi:putative ABC transport system permease protein
LRLKSGVDAGSFRRQFTSRHAQAAQVAELQNIEDIHAELEASSTTAGVRSQAYTATGISLLAAIFIIFTTLSMGVQERTRQFAVLRAIALTKSQIGAMIALESLLLGLIGWCGGLLAGWGLLQLIGVLRPDFFPAGAALGAWCVTLTGVCALGGALLAAIGPAWNATSVRPLEAMAARSNVRAPRLSRTMLLSGVAFVAVNPLVVFWIPLPDTARYLASAAVGCTCMAIGFVLLTPTVITLTERTLGPMLARLLGLNSQLLTQQLSTNLWRSLGTTVALSLGLGLFVAMQVWGYSMLGPFLPGDWMPDLLVNIPSGLSDAEVQAICQLPEVRAAECLALAVEQPKFAADITGAKQRASVTRQDNCVLFGVDPAQALAGDQPLCDLQFVEGSAAAALARLKQGNACLVPDHFQRETGLGIGDRFGMIPPNSPDRVVEYEIAGVVSLPGWHLITKGGLRTRHVRSAALVIAPLVDVRRDFGIDRIRFLSLNLADAVTKEQFQTSLQAIVTPSQANDASIASPQRAGRGSKARLQSTRELRKVIHVRSDSIIWGLSKLPLVTLLVATLGVAGTVVSSVRVRRWEFGVLRALGITRFGLMRLIVAEALLVGLAACLLSLSFGAMAGYCGTEVTRYVDVHGGPITPLVVPWSKLAIGFGITLTICLMAALGPAIRVGRSEPLDLLQAGRASS